MTSLMMPPAPAAPRSVGRPGAAADPAAGLFPESAPDRGRVAAGWGRRCSGRVFRPG